MSRYLIDGWITYYIENSEKGIDYVQEHFLGQGPQNNESAIEQAKDKQIANFIRSQYKGTTGKEFPIKEK